MRFDIFRDARDIDLNDYIIAKYRFKVHKSYTIRDAATATAYGQSIGPIQERNPYETPELLEKHCALIIDEGQLDSKWGTVRIAFPVENIDMQTCGLSHLLNQIYGGQTEVSLIAGCVLEDLQLPKSIQDYFKGPMLGIKGIRDLTGVKDTCLMGFICKPKISISSEKHVDLIKEMVDNGAYWIKSDEIQLDTKSSRFEERVKLLGKFLKNKDVIYCETLCGPQPLIMNRARFAADQGINVHINQYAGIDTYKLVRDMNLGIWIHFQRCGLPALTDPSHRFHIDLKVYSKLVALAGCDSQHIGNVIGYAEYDPNDVRENINQLVAMNCLPSLSCGVVPGAIDKMREIVGHDNFMAAAGGSVSAHPDGIGAGVRAFIQAVNRDFNGKEYRTAIEKWGYIK